MKTNDKKEPVTKIADQQFGAKTSSTDTRNRDNEQKEENTSLREPKAEQKVQPTGKDKDDASTDNTKHPDSILMDKVLYGDKGKKDTDAKTLTDKPVERKQEGKTGKGKGDGPDTTKNEDVKKEESLSTGKDNYNRPDTKTPGKEEPAITKTPKVEDNPETQKSKPVSEDTGTPQQKQENESVTPKEQQQTPEAEVKKTSL